MGTKPLSDSRGKENLSIPALAARLSAIECRIDEIAGTTCCAPVFCAICRSSIEPQEKIVPIYDERAHARCVQKLVSAHQDRRQAEILGEPSCAVCGKLIGSDCYRTVASGVAHSDCLANTLAESDALEARKLFLLKSGWRYQSEDRWVDHQGRGVYSFSGAYSIERDRQCLSTKF